MHDNALTDKIMIDETEYQLCATHGIFEPSLNFAVITKTVRVKPVIPAEVSRKSQLKFRAARMGLTYEDMEARWNDHDKLCEICGKPSEEGKRLAMDHDHATGKFRGWLCFRCNSGLGMFCDSTDVMEKAIQYLASQSLSL